MKVKTFFNKILPLCMVSIQEWFLIKSGLRWRTMGTWTRNATNNFLLLCSIMPYCAYIILRVDKNILHVIWICTVEKLFFNLLILMRLTPERRVTEGWKQAFTTILATHWKVCESQIKQIVSKVDFSPEIFSRSQLTLVFKTPPLTSC